MRTPEKETRFNVFRKKRGDSVYALADAWGVSPQTISRYGLPAEHKNHRRPNRIVADKIREWSGGFIDIANYADAWSPEIDAAWLAAGAFPATPSAEVAP